MHYTVANILVQHGDYKFFVSKEDLKILEIA